MAPRHDHVVARSRHNLLPVVAFLLLAIATSWALYQIHENNKAIEKAGDPCVDMAPGPQVVPSEGCKAFFDAITNLCAQNPKFCARSERRAARRAQEAATIREVGLTASLPTGGGGGSGNKPNSPDRPSQPPQGDGQEDGDEGQPTPGHPAQPPQGQPDKPSEPPTQPEPPAVPGRETPKGPIIDVPQVIEDTCRLVQPPLGPIIRVCP